MFDGADLSVVYGSSQLYPQPSVPPPAPSPPPAQPMPELTVPRSTQSHAMPPDPPYTPPSAMYAQQSAAAPVPQDTFWERLSQKRSEVGKFVILAMVVLLAISIDRFVTHYVSSYVAKAFLSETQEFLVRVAYPLAVILMLWIVKAM